MAAEPNPEELYASLCAKRRSIAARSPRKFASTYLMHHLRLPPSRMHREIFNMLVRSTVERGSRIAIAAPRSTPRARS